MLPIQRLIALNLSRRVDMSYSWCLFYPLFSEVILDAVIDCKVDGPCREVAEYGWTEPAVHSSYAIVLEDVLDCVWIRTHKRWERRTLSKMVSDAKPPQL